MVPLEDGTYEVIVIDAHRDEGDGTRVELALLSEAHKGGVIELKAHCLAGDPLMWLGLPGTLTVSGGVPRLSIEA